MCRTLAVTATIFILGGVSLVGSGHAASNKEDYELQERCGKRAAELFNLEFGNGISNTKEGQYITDYRNHYSKKLNKCFVLYTTTDVPYKNKKKGVSILMT